MLIACASVHLATASPPPEAETDDRFSSKLRTGAVRPPSLPPTKYFFHDWDLKSQPNTSDVRPAVHQAHPPHISPQPFGNPIFELMCAMMEAKRMGRSLVVPDSLLLDRSNTAWALNHGYYMLRDALNTTRMSQYVPLVIVNDPLNSLLRMAANKLRTLAIVPHHLTMEV